MWDNPSLIVDYIKVFRLSEPEEPEEEIIYETGIRGVGILALAILLTGLAVLVMWSFGLGCWAPAERVNTHDDEHAELDGKAPNLKMVEQS